VENKPHSGQGGLSSDANPFDSLLNKQHGLKPTAALTQPASGASPKRGEGIVIGQLVAVDGNGGTWVQFPGNPLEQPVNAVSAAQIERSHVGNQVALSFVAGNILQPLILGLVQAQASEIGTTSKQPFEIQQDGQRLVISAGQELVLKCGESTIILTKDGKITIRGKQLLSRAEGVNRIKGGAVQIN